MIDECEVNVALLSMQVRGLQADLNGMVSQQKEDKQKIADLEKQLKSSESAKNSAYENNTAYRNEIEQCHSFIDGLPYGPERFAERKDRYGSTNNVDLNLLTRIALSLTLKG